MTDFIVQLALSNLLISAALAGIAYAVHRHGRYPVLAHLLWVLVLIKVVTPPLLQLPIVPALRAQAPVAGVTLSTSMGVTPTSGLTASAGIHAAPAALADLALALLLAIWLMGSLIILGVSLVRIVRFDRLLRRSSEQAPRTVQSVATGVAWQLGLARVPAVYTSRARLSPMTWWTGGAIRVVIPAALPQRMDAAQLRWVLAHELAHVKRRDHLVRWLEWLACVAFWWNPVVWFARRNLRLDEEVSCDALVLERLEGQPRSYATALLGVVEFLAGHATRPPAIASGIDTGGSLERRFVAIVSETRLEAAPRSLVVGLLSAAVVLLSVGVGHAGAVEPSSAEFDSRAADQAGRYAASIPGVTAGAAGADASDRPRFAPISADVDVAAAMGQATSVASDPPSAWQNVFVGTPGNDVYTGSQGRDRVAGRSGADELSGQAGRDLILGGAGADAITGGAGPDRLLGGPGDDTIMGNRGRDVILAGRGSDIVRAGAGNDVVRTWRDGTADTIDCGPGDRDRAIIDSTDTSRNCEVVVVRDAG